MSSGGAHAIPRFKESGVLSLQGDSPVQEDQALVREDKGIFVLADGFGGPQSGPLAAREACEAVQSYLYKEAGDLDATLPFELRSYFSLAGNILFNGLIHANRKVLALNQKKQANARGGASVLAGYLDGSLLAIANVGACSGYVFRRGKSALLVSPRTYGKLLNPTSTEVDAWRHVPLMALGMASDLEPEIAEVRVEPGDWVLLQSTPLTEDALERVASLQARQPLASTEEILKSIEEEVTAWGKVLRNSTYLLAII